MIDCVRFDPNYMDMINLNKSSNNFTRGNLVMISSGDWHFGAMDPKYQYDTLETEFFKKIESLHFDILFILGDTLDHKVMANSDAALYASLAIKRAVDLCRIKNASLVILGGTASHDADQLKLFYHYLFDKSVDIRIVEKLKFEYIKGAKVLCIPEEYNMGAEYYNEYLFNSGLYDLAIMHGMYKNAVYGATDTNKDVSHAPTFEMSDFCQCRGCILAGHVHVSGCFGTYFYYTGTPYRWRFGEEQPKGFMITLINLDNGQHYTHFEPIQCMRYITVNLNDILNNNPEYIINYIKDLKEKQNIDYLRVQFTLLPNETQIPILEVIRKYFKTNSTIRIECENHKREQVISESKEVLDKYKGYEYILDSSLEPNDIFVRYVNQQEECDFISIDELLEILTD